MSRVIDEPWMRLAELVRARREDRRMSQQDLATAVGTTDRLIRSVEKAERTTHNRGTLRAIAEALGWTPDSIDRILRGHDPIDRREDLGDAEDRLIRLERRYAELKAELDELKAERDRTDPTKHRPG